MHFRKSGTGAAGTKYVEQYFDLEPGLKETVELISDMVTQMNRGFIKFQDTDTGMAGRCNTWEYCVCRLCVHSTSIKTGKQSGIVFKE